MKSRPRSVENEVAAYLSNIFIQFGFSPVERIPAPGRSGPDITLNELELALDAKSRVAVPETILFPIQCPFVFQGGSLVGVRLANLASILDSVTAPVDFSSVVVRRYIDHMEEWTREKWPSAISAVVLHRPKLPIGNSVFVIYFTDYERLKNRWMKKTT